MTAAVDNFNRVLSCYCAALLHPDCMSSVAQPPSALCCLSGVYHRGYVALLRIELKSFSLSCLLPFLANQTGEPASH